jgi:tetratricopeptide (TPR) repeat protein
VILSAETLEHIRELGQRGLYLQAHRRALEYGPLRDWTGAEAGIVAAWLAWHLGAQRLGQAIYLRTWRAEPTDATALYCAGRVVLERRGPVLAWDFLRRNRSTAEPFGDVEARLLSLDARIAGLLRDFSTAESCIDRAEASAPESTAVAIERSFLLQMQDRYAESLACAQRAVELGPDRPHCKLALAHALTLVGREREALELLLVESRSTESGAVMAVISGLQAESDDFAGALASLDRYAELSPMMDRNLSRWLAVRRSDLAYRLGDVESAVRFAELCETPFHETIAERLKQKSDGRRVQLDVLHVGQHHKTCAPATLTAIGRYWSRPVDHLEVAEQICYDGTPAYSERVWAERNGFAAREFTVTWQNAVALLDRGVPFTLTTVAPDMGHLQAVIGYDDPRGTLLVRDPGQRELVELLGSGLLEATRSTGPRGMLLVPAEQANLVEGLTLDDVQIWDRHHRVMDSLSRHDRAEAHGIYRSMSVEAPEHILTLQARRALAFYDADATNVLACTDRYLAQFPDDPSLQLSKAHCLLELGRRREARDLLEEICRRPRCHPAVRQRYALELAEDARNRRTATRLIRRGLAVGLLDGQSLWTLGNMEWNRQQFDLALHLYRFAACVNDMDEFFAFAYFRAAFVLGRDDEALSLLEDRVRRFGSKSGWPLLTLYRAYEHRRDSTREVRALSRVGELHPEDGQLLLGIAHAFADRGEVDQAEALLTRAEGRSKKSDWLRASATLATCRNDLARALELWNEVLLTEPLALDANSEVTRLLKITESRAAAAAHLETVARRAPHHLQLQRLWIDWLLESDRPRAEQALRHLIEHNPVDSWARLQLALLLGRKEAFDEAFAELELAILMDPSNPDAHDARGRVYVRAGRVDEAKEAFRRAIELSIDSERSFSALLSTCRSVGERREALDHIRTELERQIPLGNAIWTYFELARATIEPEELAAELERLAKCSPQDRRIWSLRVRHLLALSRVDDARELAEAAVRRFPEEIRAWLDLAAARRQASDAQGEEEALSHAVRLDPGHDEAHRQLADFHERNGRLQQAKELLERAVTVARLNALNHGCLTQVLHKLGERDDALAHARQALRLAPSYDWAWQTLLRLATELERPQLATDFARELTGLRAGDVDAWIGLARILEKPDDLAECLQALDRALTIDPRCVEGHDLRAERLANCERFEEALCACRPAIGDDSPPTPLRGRAAWVLAARGEPEEAIERMRAVLSDDPDYHWGWQQISRWQRSVGATFDHLESAIKMVELEPQDPVSRAWLGHARLSNHDPRGAMEEFGRAVEMEPDFVYAASPLFELQLDAMELDAAARTLEAMRVNLSEPERLSRLVCLNVAAGNEELATADLEKLCFLDGTDADSLATAIEAVDARWPRASTERLDRWIDAEGIQPVVVSKWIEQLAARGSWRSCRRTVESLHRRGELGRTAAQTFLESLAEARRSRDFRVFVRRHRGFLRDDDSLWGTVLYALVHLGRLRQAAHWASDWQRRDAVEAWMLSNMVLALRGIGQPEEATRASLKAMTCPPDDTSALHALWLAIEEGLAGETAVAETWLGKARRKDAYGSFLYNLARALIDDFADPARTFSNARSRVEDAERILPNFSGQPELRRTHRRVLLCIARRRGGILANLWGWRRSLRI